MCGQPEQICLRAEHLTIPNRYLCCSEDGPSQLVGPVNGKVVLPYTHPMCCQVICAMSGKNLDIPVTIAKNQNYERQT